MAIDSTDSRVHEVTELFRSWRRGDGAALDRMTLNDRTHFFGGGQVDASDPRRSRPAKNGPTKRGGAVTMMSLDNVSPPAPQPSIVDVLALDQALGVSSATVEREWAMAKAWLYQRLSVHP